jgi:hypothetical protein
MVWPICAKESHIIAVDGNCPNSLQLFPLPVLRLIASRSHANSIPSSFVLRAGSPVVQPSCQGILHESKDTQLGPSFLMHINLAYSLHQRAGPDLDPLAIFQIELFLHKSLIHSFPRPRFTA